MSWSCPVSDVDELQERLRQAQLRFVYIADPSDEQMRRGLLCGPMFDPTVGIFSGGNELGDVRQATVRRALEEADLLPKSPGTEGSTSVADAVLRMYSHDHEPPKFEMITERRVRQALPVDLNGRVLQVERFHYMPVSKMHRSLND